MARMTHSQCLTYIAQEPRTMGWGALLIYDRTKTNALLAQGYIEHFNAGSYFPEFNETADTDQGSWTVMNHFVFDQPRLSFTNSNIASSRARLAMRVVSGNYLSMKKPLGGNQAAIVSVAKPDPLIVAIEDARRLTYAYHVLPVPFTSVKRLASAMAHEKPNHSKGA